MPHDENMRLSKPENNPRGPEEKHPGEADKSSSQTPDHAPGEREIGGPRGPEPTRYGDWERKGRCIDF